MNSLEELTTARVENHGKPRGVMRFDSANSRGRIGRGGIRRVVQEIRYLLGWELAGVCLGWASLLVVCDTSDICGRKTMD